MRKYIFEAYGRSRGGPNAWCKKEYSVEANSLRIANKKIAETLNQISTHPDKTFKLLKSEALKEIT